MITSVLVAAEPYSIWVIDGNSGLHQIVLDPQNGVVLLANQTMSMTGPFS